PARTARSGKHSDVDVDGESDIAGESRQVCSDKYSWNAAAFAAGKRSAVERSAREVALDARSYGAASVEHGLRKLSQADGSDRPRSRKLRCDRPLANGGWRSAD